MKPLGTTIQLEQKMRTEEEFLTDLIQKYRKYMRDLLGDKKNPIKLDDANWGLYVATSNIVIELEARLQQIVPILKEK